MNKPKTYFEQVPLEIVKEILGKQADVEVEGANATETDIPALPGKPKSLKRLEKSGIAKRLRKERV